MHAIASKSHSALRTNLDKLATRQFGVVSRAQLRLLGMSRSAIEHAVQTGRLHPIFRGVYALGGVPIGTRGRMYAATLTCGDGTVVSHRSAAALMGLLDKAPLSVHVIGRRERGRTIDGIRSHPASFLAVHETGTFDGIPCTSPARTLVDVATEVGMQTLRSCFERAAARGILDVAAVEASLRPGRPGAPAIRTLLDEWRPALPAGSKPKLKSPLEAMVLPLLAKRGLHAPRCNAPVQLAEGRRIEVDFLWPEQRFVLEADSRDYHGTDAAFERDRWRDRELMRAGYGWLRVTKRQAEREAEAVAAAIASRLT
jgi:predicted transcriptional regulator of viral defense system/very-short-patch-repair endonuclease